MGTTVKKTQTANTGKYSYKYTDLAEIHAELERQGITYHQYIDICPDGNGDLHEFVFTEITYPDRNELACYRGCEVLKLSGPNPVQEYGKAITYARRYSLLMALGWATEDDDAQGITREPAPRNVNMSEISAILETCAELGIEREAVYQRFGIYDLEQMTLPQFQSFLRMADKTREARENSNA